MHRKEVRITAICIAAERTSAICNPVGDDHARNRNGIHAMLEPVVLAPSTPVQILAHLLVALIGTDGLLRQDLDGSEEVADRVTAPIPAICGVDGLADNPMLFQLEAEPIREEDGVRVHLYREV